MIASSTAKRRSLLSHQLKTPLGLAVTFVLELELRISTIRQPAETFGVAGILKGSSP